MTALEFRVLGPLEVRRAGLPVPLTAAKQRRLLSLLLLQANEPFSQDELIDAVWDVHPPRTARAAFQNLVHALRKQLGSDAIERTPAGYLVSTRSAALDLDRLHRLAAAARGDPPAQRVERLREALALWRGPAFPDLAGHAVAEARIARLEDERLALLEDRIEAELELGAASEAVAELEELVARHPSRERFWAQLMLALYRAGRQADALGAYQRAHHVFVELGLEPGVVLRQLQRAILVQDPALDDPRRTLGSTLERAAAILPREPRERAESLYEYGAALIQLGDLRSALTSLQAARRLAEGAGARGLAERSRVRVSYLAVFAEGGPLADHLAVCERAGEVFEELGDVPGLAFALAGQAHMHRDLGRAERALELASRAAELAAQAGDAAIEEGARRMAATAAAMGPTPVADALALCRSADEAGGECHPPPSWDVQAWLLAQAGHIEDARELAERSLDALHERGLALRLSVGLAYTALGERAVGNLERAAELLRRCYDLVRAEGVRGDIAASAGDLACVLALGDDVAEASRLTDEARAFASGGDAPADVLWRRAEALLAARKGRHHEAAQLADAVSARAERTDMLTFRGETWEDVAHVRRLAGEAAGEAAALRSALAVYEQKGNVVGAERVQSKVAGSDARAA